MLAQSVEVGIVACKAAVDVDCSVVLAIAVVAVVAAAAAVRQSLPFRVGKNGSPLERRRARLPVVWDFEGSKRLNVESPPLVVDVQLIKCSNQCSCLVQSRLCSEIGRAHV